MTTPDPTKLADELASAVVNYQRDQRASERVAMLVSNNLRVILAALRRPTPPPDVAKWREAIEHRLRDDDSDYNKAFNNGLRAALDAIASQDAPSRDAGERP